MSWIQANKALPCPICGRTHYCSLNPDEGIVKCTQLSDGSFTQRKDAAGMGFFHNHDFSDIVVPDTVVREVKPIPSWDRVIRMSLTAPRRHLRTLSRLLGGTPANLIDCEIGFLTHKQIEDLGTTCNHYGCWTFPMKNAQGKVIGVRLRTPDGFKYALKGSRNGLFYSTLSPTQPVLIVDGASDAYKGHLHHLNIIGRPSSTTGNELLLELFKDLRPLYVDQLLDADDNENREHARSTANELLANLYHGSIFYPPRGKDLREWLEINTSVPNRLSRLARTCGKTGTP